jgi:O-acetyl-ADP-ribose deacetylase (regulator of RNase III)
MELWLVDQNTELVNAWKQVFSDLPNVFVQPGDILSIAENAIVSPANSLGMMDGGIDLAYLNRFGLGMQQRLFDAIAEQPDRLLPVGAAVLIETGDSKIPFLISAPTMKTPEPVPKANAFFAMSAALMVAERHEAKIQKLFCPGLATGIGCVAPIDAANEMANAYRKWLRRRGLADTRSDSR